MAGFKRYEFSGKAIRRMTSDDISDTIREIMGHLTVRQKKFVQCKMGGMSNPDAMDAAGYACRGNAHQHFRIQGRNARTIMELIDERASREVVASASDVRRKMWDVYHQAFDDRDWSSTLRALEAVCKLDGLNAIEQLKLIVDVKPEREIISDIEWEVLSIMTHDIDPSKVLEHDSSPDPRTIN